MKSSKFDFDKYIERRGTRSVKWDSGSDDLLPMFVADMDFLTSPEVLKALHERVDHGVFGYGIYDDVPAILAKWFLNEFGQTVDESWIVLLSSTTATLSAASHLREGKVMTTIPNYNGLLSAPLRAGKEVILSPLVNTDEFYEIDFAGMQKLVEPSAKLFFLCNPHNPVGRVYTKEELLKLSGFAKKNGMIVISDEVHSGLVFDRPHIPYFSVDEYAMENSITIMGQGKTFNLAGLPFGFAVIPNKELRAEFINTCYAVPYPGVLSVTAAKAAYGESAEWKKALVEYLRAGRDYLEKRLRAFLPPVKLTHVEGTYLQWVDFRPLGIAEPFKWLREKAKILVSDGKIFGREGYVRINFGTTRSRLEDALDRIEKGVKAGL